MTFPFPSLKVDQERLPAAAFSTTTTGMEAETTPVMAPTLPSS